MKDYEHLVERDKQKAQFRQGLRMVGLILITLLVVGFIELI